MANDDNRDDGSSVSGRALRKSGSWASFIRPASSSVYSQPSRPPSAASGVPGLVASSSVYSDEDKQPPFISEFSRENKEEINKRLEEFASAPSEIVANYKKMCGRDKNNIPAPWPPFIKDGDGRSELQAIVATSLLTAYALCEERKKTPIGYDPYTSGAFDRLSARIAATNVNNYCAAKENEPRDTEALNDRKAFLKDFIPNTRKMAFSAEKAETQAANDLAKKQGDKKYAAELKQSAEQWKKANSGGEHFRDMMGEPLSFLVNLLSAIFKESVKGAFDIAAAGERAGREAYVAISKSTHESWLKLSEGEDYNQDAKETLAALKDYADNDIPTTVKDIKIEEREARQAERDAEKAERDREKAESQKQFEEEKERRDAEKAENQKKFDQEKAEKAAQRAARDAEWEKYNQEKAALLAEKRAKLAEDRRNFDEGKRSRSAPPPRGDERKGAFAAAGAIGKNGFGSLVGASTVGRGSSSLSPGKTDPGIGPKGRGDTRN